MSTEQNKVIVHRIFDEIFNKGDAAAADRLVAENDRAEPVSREPRTELVSRRAMVTSSARTKRYSI